jgi:hypothetical protein
MSKEEEKALRKMLKIPETFGFVVNDNIGDASESASPSSPRKKMPLRSPGLKKMDLQ